MSIVPPEPDSKPGPHERTALDRIADVLAQTPSAAKAVFRDVDGRTIDQIVASIRTANAEDPPLCFACGRSLDESEDERSSGLCSRCAPSGTL